MRRGKRLGIDGRLSRPHPAVALELGHSPTQVDVDQPVAGGHRAPVIEQRSIGDHHGPPVVVRDGHLESALGRAAEQASYCFGLSGRQGRAGGATNEQRPRESLQRALSLGDACACGDG